MVVATKNKSSKLISAKEIVHNFHISYQTVNHYTDFGLLTVSNKKGNIRFYDRAQVGSRLKIINGLISEGYSLRLIRKRLIGI